MKVHWVTLLVALVAGYFIGKMYPNIFARIGGAAA